MRIVIQRNQALRVITTVRSVHPDSFDSLVVPHLRL